MALIYLDRCQFLTATTGLTDFAVGAAVTGYQTPASAGAANGDTFHYVAQSGDLTQWEVGLGTYSTTGPTLARTTILFSSNANAKVSFTSAPQIYATATAEGLSNASLLTSGTLPAARLPNPSATTLGGIQSLAAVAHKFLSSISTAGVPGATQPATSDLSDFVGLTSWTPADASGAGLALTINYAKYIDIGGICFLFYNITYPVNASGVNMALSGLPFNPLANLAMSFAAVNMPTPVPTQAFVLTPSNHIQAYNGSTQTIILNSDLSGASMSGFAVYPH